MRKKHVPERTCVGCGAKKQKAELLRFSVSRKRSDFRFDETGRLPGRGIYSCRDEICLKDFLNRAKKGKVRNLKGVDLGVVEREIRKALEGLKGDDAKVQR